MKKRTNRPKAPARNNMNFERIMRGLEDAAAYTRGEADPTKYRVHVPASVDVAAIRAKVGFTQEVFAARFGFSQASANSAQGDRPKALTRAAVL